ncbi:MAG: hypothetical protein E7393_05640 [Ruminococcaceae bacterium]|nr:hypothetical protein [Oscillospiraceae bacterium]
MKFSKLAIFMSVVMALSSCLCMTAGATTESALSMSNGTPLVDVDFEEIGTVNSPYTFADMSTLIGVTCHNTAYGPFGGQAKIVEDATSGNRMLEIDLGTITSFMYRFGFTHTFATPVSSGVVTASFKVKSTGGQVFDWGMFSAGTALNDTFDTDIRGIVPEAWQGTCTSFAKDSNGWFHVGVYAKKTATGWSISYDDLNAEGETFVVESYTTASALTAFNLIGLTLDSTPPPKIYFDDISIVHTPNLAIDGTQPALTPQPDQESFAVTLTQALSGTKIGATITDAGDSTIVIAADCVTNPTDKTITISPKSYLEHGKTYTLAFTGLDTCLMKNGVAVDMSLAPTAFTTTSQPGVTASPATVSYQTAEGAPVSLPYVGTCQAVGTATLNNDGSEKSVMALLAAYDVNGVVLKAAKTEITLAANAINAPISVTLTGLNGEKVDHTAWFVVDVTDGRWTLLP